MSSAGRIPTARRLARVAGALGATLAAAAALFPAAASALEPPGPALPAPAISAPPTSGPLAVASPPAPQVSTATGAVSGLLPASPSSAPSTPPAPGPSAAPTFAPAAGGARGSGDSIAPASAANAVTAPSGGGARFSNGGSAPALAGAAAGAPGGLFSPPSLPPGAAGTTVAVALVLLPIVLVVWLLVAFKMLVAARRRKSDDLRLALAAELGLRPMDLEGLSPAALDKLQAEMALDELTGALRRGPGIEALRRECSRAARRGARLAVAFVDVDGLKEANDTRGHAAGDALLRGVAGALRERLRGQDVVFRFGGDEFVCVLAETTAGQAEDVFAALAASARQNGMSFSYGVAEYAAGDEPLKLLGRADAALYRQRELRRRAGEVVPSRDRGPRRRLTLG